MMNDFKRKKYDDTFIIKSIPSDDTIISYKQRNMIQNDVFFYLSEIIELYEVIPKRCRIFSAKDEILEHSF